MNKYKSYIYTYNNIIISLRNMYKFVANKSKVINPNAIGNMNCAGWEDTVNAYVDSINIIDKIPNKQMQYIIYAVANGYTEDEIAQDLCCSQPNVNQLKNTIRKEIRYIQIYDI